MPLALVLAGVATLVHLSDASAAAGSAARIAAGTAAAQARAAAARQTWTIAMPEGRALSVAITVGNVRIFGEARDDALIEVVRTAPSAAALARIPAVLDEGEEHIQVSALQADDGTDPAYRTDVTLRVPRTAHLRSITIVEGRLDLERFTGRITAEVQRGDIDAADVAGTIRLETSIGDIDLSGARAVAGGLLRLRTFNGDVRLTFGERPRDARILTLALNGSIVSDIPLAMKDTWGPRAGETTLGSGDPVVSIDVVTGRIELRVP